LKFMWRRECRTAGRLHSLVKLRKRYVKNFSYIDIELNKSYRIYIDFELLLVCSQTQLGLSKIYRPARTRKTESILGDAGGLYWFSGLKMAEFS
jgi:hypothetical protein